jgi:acyl carrier protein
MLASYGDRTPADVLEQIDSLELAWLVHQVEQRYGVQLDLNDDTLMRMSTVTAVVEILAQLFAKAAAHEAGMPEPGRV